MVNDRDRITKSLNNLEGLSSQKVVKNHQQGCYFYAVNDEATTITEPWRIFENQIAQQIIQTARFIPDNDTIIVAEIASDKQLTLEQIVMLEQPFVCNFIWYKNARPLQHVRYENNDSGFWYQLISEAPSTPVAIELTSAQTQFFPLFRLFSGALVNQISLLEAADVVVPDIRQGEATSALFAPYVSKRSSKILAKTNIEYQGRSVQCRKIQFISDIYLAEDDAFYWLNDDNLLLQYQWQMSPEQCWKVNLATIGNKPC